MHRPHKSTQRRTTTRRSKGFTLVELLVVIAIVAALAALAFSVARKALRSAAGAKDMSTMRQIWQTIPLYAGDHADTLPGPLNTGQKSLYGLPSTGRLSYYVAEDLGLSDLKSGDFIEPMSFSWQKSAKSRNAPSFFVREKLPLDANSQEFVRPWGHPLATDKDDRKPKKMAAVMSVIDASRAWVMSDLDQLHPDAADAGWKADIPEKMSHDTYRIAIYFDGHAGKLDVDNNPK